MTDPHREYRVRMIELLASNSPDRWIADVFLASAARARASVINNIAFWTEVDAEYPWLAGVMELAVDMAVRDTLAVLIEKDLLHGD